MRFDCKIIYIIIITYNFDWEKYHQVKIAADVGKIYMRKLFALISEQYWYLRAVERWDKGMSRSFWCCNKTSIA